MKITIQEIDKSVLEGIGPAWMGLCKKCSIITPFQFPQWLIPWWKVTGSGRLKGVAFFEEGVLTGLALFFIHENEQGKNTLCFVGTGISDYLDVVALPGYESKVADSVLEYLADIRSQWDECDLQDIPESSVLLHCGYPDIFTVKRSDCNICSHLELPSNPDRFRTQLSKKLRKNLSRAARMLGSGGGYHLEMADESSVEHFIRRLFDLHRARWESRNQAGVLDSGTLRTFHREAAPGLIRNGLLRIYEMRYNHKSIAIYYTLAQQDAVYAYLGGFDPSMEKYSPGVLLLFHVVEDSLKRGAGKFDFLRGNEAYKNHWKPVFCVNSRIQISKKRE